MATPGIVDVPELLDQQKISRYQIRVAALCAAVVFLDGFDTQVIGNLLPSIIAEFKPNSIAMTAEYAPRRRQATMVMVMFCGFPIGASFAGFISAYLIPAVGWRAVLYLGGALPIALVPLLLAELPESIRHLVLRGNQTAPIAAILARINPTRAFPDGTRFAIGEEHGHGVPVGHLFREGRAAPTVLLWIVFFMSLLNIFLINFWLPTLTHDAGISLVLANMATGFFQAGGVISTLLGGRAVDAYGAYRVLTPAYVLAGLSIAALGFAVVSPPLLLIIATVAGFCLIGGQTGVNALASTFYPTFIRSTGVGWALGIGRIGSIAGPGVGGILIALRWPTTAIFIIGGVAALCAALALFAMGRTPAARDQLSARPRAAA
jgi:MFS transporter, AAHS family, 4-hydroxybenzoate transporter